MASKSIDELLEKYKFTQLEIVSVGDFKIKTAPFYFKVIFKYTDSNGKNRYPVVIYKNKSYSTIINVTGGLRFVTKQFSNPRFLLKIS